MNYHHGPNAPFGVGVWTAIEDRDASRAAAERYFLLQNLPERGQTGRGQRSRPTWRLSLPAFASRARRAAA